MEPVTFSVRTTLSIDFGSRDGNFVLSSPFINVS